jgi:hypothetical protein
MVNDADMQDEIGERRLWSTAALASDQCATYSDKLRDGDNADNERTMMTTMRERLRTLVPLCQILTTPRALPDAVDA